MTINLIYIFVVIIAFVYGIKTYIDTKHQMIWGGLAILIFSFILEIQRINNGDYITNTSDIFRTIRDIIWTILMVFGFRLAYRLKK